MRTLDPEELESSYRYQLLNSIVVPRPIAWIASISSEEKTNLAPHSYTTIAAVDPATVLFVSAGVKDTVRNIRETKCFVVNIVNRELGEQMNVTAADAPAGISEFDLAHLETAPSETIAAPRVADAPIAMECVFDQEIIIGSRPSVITFGRVTRIHIADELFDDRDTVNPEALDAIARMGGSLYSTTHERFSMKRPRYTDLV